MNSFADNISAWYIEEKEKVTDITSHSLGAGIDS